MNEPHGMSNHGIPSAYFADSDVRLQYDVLIVRNLIFSNVHTYVPCRKTSALLPLKWSREKNQLRIVRTRTNSYTYWISCQINEYFTLVDFHERGSVVSQYHCRHMPEPEVQWYGKRGIYSLSWNKLEQNLEIKFRWKKFVLGKFCYDMRSSKGYRRVN